MVGAVHNCVCVRVFVCVCVFVFVCVCVCVQCTMLSERWLVPSCVYIGRLMQGK